MLLPCLLAGFGGERSPGGRARPEFLGADPGRIGELLCEEESNQGLKRDLRLGPIVEEMLIKTLIGGI